jgi:hypothetical protein
MNRFHWEFKEFTTPDIIDKSLVRLLANKKEGIVDTPTYYNTYDKLMALKKFKFTKEYEQWKDKEMYDWMKYKVAAEIGGPEEKEAFALFEKIKMDSKGEAGYRLWRESIEKDPAA